MNDLLLQDMALPAADRLSRLIQKTISENPQILEQYRSCLYEFKESTAVEECLDDEIMDTYFPNLECLIARYYDLNTRFNSYNYRHAIKSIVEYEIRHQLNKEGEKVLQSVAKKILRAQKHLFLTEIFS